MTETEFLEPDFNERAMRNNPPDFSIVIPVYFNEGSLKPLYQKLQTEVLQKCEWSAEIIFVDDGSGDGSFAELMDLYQKNKECVRVIKLTRNFGQVPAVLAGLQMAKGKCIVWMSADLQDPPSLILEMLHSFFHENYEIVICHRQSRDEGWFRRFSSAFFYRMVKKYIIPNMPGGGFDYSLFSQKVKNSILINNEHNSFLQAQILLTGYKYKLIPYHREERQSGRSRWTFAKKMKYLIDGFLAYSYLPLRLMSISGFFIAMAGFLYAVIIIFARILNDVPFKGWAPLMILILVLSGIQMLMLGIIGEYLWRTLDQVRNRPQYIVEQVYE